MLAERILRDANTYCHVVLCSSKRPGKAVDELAAHSKVAQLDDAKPGHEDVRRLDITMDDFFLVHVIEPPEYLHSVSVRYLANDKLTAEAIRPSTCSELLAPRSIIRCMSESRLPASQYSIKMQI
jgi:hypothetical protein